MSIVLLILVATGVVGAWRWRTLVRRVRTGEIGRISAGLQFVLVAFGPLFAGTALLLVAVAIEEVTARVVVSERATLLLMPFIALGTCGSAAFGVRLLALRPAPRGDSAARLR